MILTNIVGSVRAAKHLSAHVLRRPALLFSLAACTDATEPPIPAELLPNSPVSLTGTAGQPVSPSPAVMVRDQRGDPIVGVPVVFTVASGGGSLSAPGAVTDQSGIATIGSWTLGPKTGTNTAMASISGLGSVTFTVTFTATGGPGAPASLEKLGGDNQTAIAGSQVAAPPSVIVRDINGNPVPGVPVFFAPTDNQSAVTGAQQTTNDAGIATVGAWRLAARQGAFVLDAAAGSLKVSFRATAVFGPPVSLSLVGGNNQTGRTRSDLNRHLEVVVRDVNGNPSPGVPVVFEVVAGGGSVINGTQTTNGAGTAALSQWILGAIGPQTVRATVAGIPSVVFSATASPPVPDGPAFDLDDPFGDTSAGASNRQDPPIYDLLAARAEFKGDTLIIAWTFNVPVAPRVLSPNPAGLNAVIFIDADENAQTGFPIDGVGADYSIRSEGGTASTVTLSGDLFTQIPASFAGNTFTVRIPLARLAGDDGNITLVARFFSAEGVVDVFPNLGVIRVRAPTNVSASRSR